MLLYFGADAFCLQSSRESCNGDRHLLSVKGMSMIRVDATNAYSTTIMNWITV